MWWQFDRQKGSDETGSSICSSLVPVEAVISSVSYLLLSWMLSMWLLTYLLPESRSIDRSKNDRFFIFRYYTQSSLLILILL